MESGRRRSLTVFDAHCDSLTNVEDLSVLLEERQEGHWDLSRFVRGGGRWQVLAVFTPPRYRGKEAFLFAVAHVEKALEWMEASSRHLRLILSKRDLRDDGRVGILLALEGASPLIGRVDLLRIFFRLGVRLITLTWNYGNELADGVGVSDPKGLTEAGRKVVDACQNLGIAVDVSHLSLPSFISLMEVAEKPVIASHSNFYSLCPHRRNLTDKQALQIARRGGVIGLTFVPEFVGGGANRFLDHFFHGLQLVDQDHLAVGSDFDGCTNPVYPDASHYADLDQDLKKRGVPITVRDRFFSKNLLKFFKSVLPP
ncbi:MAG: membrane dipeptidase [Armatimonadetes bacterium]|nr:membrane dipeptidase [Armatimonadota bacterium]MDW8123025.1 membrane dipeptidase [Armatimonadota bacterium]